MTQDNRTDQEKKKRKRKRKSKQTLTRAVPHIRLSDPNIGKLEALDQLASAFMALTQQYVNLFCTQQDSPDGYAEPIIATDLSERWQRVAIQQAAGIGKRVAYQSTKRLQHLPERSRRVARGERKEAGEPKDRAGMARMEPA